jgi:hypothetical protein
MIVISFTVRKPHGFYIIMKGGINEQDYRYTLSG